MKTKVLFLIILFISIGIEGQNLHNDSNAVSIESETNSTNGWTSSGSTITSDATESQNGLYSLKIVSNDGSNDSGRYKFDVVNGTTYNISIWAKRGALGTSQIFKNWVGLGTIAQQPVTSTTWTEYTFTVTAGITGKAQIRCYATSTGGTALDELFIDSVTITDASVLDTEAPSAVTSLAALNTTTTTTQLSWTASSDNIAVTDYEVFQDGGSIGFTGGATTFNVSGLNATTPYAYTVLARDAVPNISLPGNTVNIVTLADTEAPNAVIDLAAFNTSATTTQLSWTASSDNIAVTDYEVFQDGGSLGFSGGATTFNVTGLSASTSYAFTVLARDAVPNISLSGNTINVTTSTPPDTELPSPVLDLVVSNTTLTSTDLLWTASTDNVGVSDYEVFQNGVSIGLTGGVTSFTVLSLTPNTSYAFTVFARDAVGNLSLTGNTANITTLADTEAPSAVTTVLASNVTSTSVDLSWTASTDNVAVSDYEVFQDGISRGFTGGTTAFSVTGLLPITNYAFTVSARDAVPNISASGNTANVLTVDANYYTTDNANLVTVDWTARDLFANRNVGIGTTNTQGYRLAVAGNVVAEEIKVALQGNWPDFVFKNSYYLPTLKEVEAFIKKKGHLINIPSAFDVEKSGIRLGEMNGKLLQKIEELTLYIIEQQKRIEKIECENEQVKSILDRLTHIENQLKIKD